MKVSRHHRSQRGFTLMEVLVAFAILGLCIGALMQVFAQGLRNVSLAEEYTHAALHAQSLLARVGVELPLEEGEQSGQLDELYRYQINVEPFALPDLDPEELRGELYRVVIAVAWGDEKPRSFALETLRVQVEEP